MKFINFQLCFSNFEKNHKTFSTCFFYVLYFLAAIWLFTPTPFSVVHNLEVSWIWALNENIGHNFLFGSDIIWTYGPYGLMLAPTWSPALYCQTIILCGYVALSFALVSLLIFKKEHWYGISIMLIGVLSQQTLFMCYPLLVGIWIVKAHLENQDFNLRQKTLLTVVLLFPFGLFFLIKGSLQAVCLGVWVVALCCALFRKSYLIAGIYFIVFPLSVLVFWSIAGQPLGNFGLFFKGNSEMIAGFTEAMSIHMRPGVEPIVFGLVSLGLLITIFCNRNAIITKILLAMVLSAFLFSAFKAGFVRHDTHIRHAFIGVSIVTGLLPFINKTSSAEKHSWLIPACLIAGFWGLFCQSHNIVNRLIFYDRKAYQANYDKSLNNLKKTNIFPILAGTTDIYPIEISMLLASGNKYNPRPVLQSYSAYTPYLINANVNHLLGENAPDNLFFSVKSIDGRFRSLDDGASWPVILSRYRPVKIIKDFLILQKAEPKKLAENTLLKTIGHLGEMVNVPESDGLIFVKLKIHQTWLGKLAQIIFKPTTLHIQVVTENEQKVRYRIVSTMTETGFLLSPLVTNTLEFAALYDFTPNLGKEVTAFSIDVDHGRYQWQRDYEIEFVRIEPPSSDEEQMRLLQIAKPVYNLSSKADLQNCHDIGQVEEKSSAITLQSTGRDPYFSLPVTCERGDYVALIRAWGVDEQFQLFYKSNAQTAFNGQDSIRFSVNRKRDVLVKLPKDIEIHKLRLDPGARPGEYTIEKFQVLKLK